MGIIVLGMTIVLQLMAAVLALRLIRITAKTYRVGVACPGGCTAGATTLPLLRTVTTGVVPVPP